MENENFIFYSFDKDKECIEALADILDENHDRIANNLNVQLQEKVIVEVYPDIVAFHNAIGMPKAPDWLVGIAKENKIYIEINILHIFKLKNDNNNLEEKQNEYKK
jgi:hypothetical protein